MKLPAISEADFQSKIIEIATLKGWRHYHTYNSRRSVSGFPDVIFIRPPELVIVEFKKQDGVVSPTQEQWLIDFRACGVETYVWRPSDETAAVLRFGQARKR